MYSAEEVLGAVARSVVGEGNRGRVAAAYLGGEKVASVELGVSDAALSWVGRGRLPRCCQGKLVQYRPLMQDSLNAQKFQKMLPQESHAMLVPTAATKKMHRPLALNSP